MLTLGIKGVLLWLIMIYFLFVEIPLFGFVDVDDG